MRIEHIAMYVVDLEEAKKFFINYFDAKASEKYHNTKTGFSSYFLVFDGEARLEIMNKPNLIDVEKQIEHNGYIHLAFSVGSKEKVNLLSQQLKADGFKVVSEPRTTGDGYYEGCIVGFENNIIEITI